MSKLTESLVFPARAGMSLLKLQPGHITQGVPRASGDEPDGLISRAELKQCSPRERG